MRDLRGWLVGRGGVRGWVGDCEEAWAVVLLGLGLLLGLFWGCLHLRDRTGSELSHQHPTLCLKPAVWGILASLVLASPFSEWFSSFASASAFSFAFLVFLSSFLSFTAFSFCKGGRRKQRWRVLRGGEQSHSGQGDLLPLLPSWPLVQAWAGPVSTTTTEKNQATATLVHRCRIASNFPSPSLITANI